MPQDDAVPQAGPTCPLSDEEIEQTFVTGTLQAVALAAVAAERARLREALKTSTERIRFDIACREVDANQRRA